ncbi:MAG: hypothetical protein WCJ33_06625, partial [Pseudomonadota bacterium]
QVENSLKNHSVKTPQFFIENNCNPLLSDDFIIFYNKDFDKNKTDGWKIHLAIPADQAQKAFDVIAPILVEGGGYIQDCRWQKTTGME